jgi:hypothetical protein
VSLGLGASLLLLLCRSAAELGRMAELRAQMERLMTDVREGGRGCGDGHTDSVVSAGATASLGGSESAGHRETMGQMEAELEAELSRLQLDSNDEKNVTPRRVEVASRSRKVSSSIS